MLQQNTGKLLVPLLLYFFFQAVRAQRLSQAGVAAPPVGTAGWHRCPCSLALGTDLGHHKLWGWCQLHLLILFSPLSQF